MKINFKKIIATLVISGGMFLSANAQWAPVGSASFGPGPDALIPFNGDLYVGGGFFSPYSDITKWNGTAYSSTGVSPTQGVLAFATFDSVLYVATYNAIYQVIGASVSTIANLDDPCYALCFWNHALYAGGWMDSVGLAGSRKKVGHIAKYSGAKWDSIAVEVDYWPYAMTIYNGQLAVGGEFNYSTKQDTLYGVGLWNGTNWTPCKKGIHGNGVYSIATYNGNLIIGGNFDTANHVYCQNIAQWDGTNWSSVGPKGQSGTVYALGNFNNTLVAGGYYDSINAWNGTAWTCMGGMPLYSEIQAFTVYNGNLYAAGNTFSMIGGVTVNDIAEYTLPTGIAEVAAESGVTVYPNPNNGVFTIKSSGISGQSSVEIYNMLGEKVYSNQFLNLNSEFLINISGHAAGIYIYRILSENGSPIATGKVIVK